MAQSSAEVQFEVSAPKTDFYLGEVIPLELKFSSAVPNRFVADSRQYDRIGRLNYVEQFLVEPADGLEDPLAGSSRANGGMGGLSGGPLVLSGKPFAFERILNEYVRFRRPGEFRLRVVSRRVTEVDDPKQLESLPRMAAGKPVELSSNVLTLSIHPATEAWTARQIADARDMLAQPSGDRRQAIATLRALGTVEAAMELVRDRGDDAQFAAEMTILGSPRRNQLLPLLEQRLAAPDQSITQRQIGALAQLAEIVALGRMPGSANQAGVNRGAELRRQKEDEYVARLIAALPAKQPNARAVSLHALLAVGMRTGEPAPWLASIASTLIGEIRTLPLPIQTQLLEAYWSAVKTPALLPFLRELLDSPQLRNTALRRIYELAPGEGRTIILEEIRRPVRHFEFSVLAMLPDHSLPDLENALAERMDPLLILRYASGDIVKQVEEKYFSRPDKRFCAGPLAFYFLKYDRPVGERLLRADMAGTDLPPICYNLASQFDSLGRWAYSAALERIAISLLTSDKVPVKRGAAELLGKYGSVDAKKPLWDTMEYFRSWWKDREDQLDQPIGEESRRLESSLRTALAHADAWVLSQSELLRLLDLCSSDWCRSDVRSWMAANGGKEIRR